MDGFEDLVAYVEDETGFVTSYYDDAYLKRRIQARIRRTDADDFESYLSLLKADGAEREALLDAFSINVTSFFRNPDVWEGVREIMRSLTARGRQVTLWSAACSDGREPYTMALLALSDPEIDDSLVRITATDIDREVLALARRGVYVGTRMTDIGDQLAPLDGYERYVTRDGDRFEVGEEVRSMVTFERHDLISGSPKRNFDLVACRNLFIYIDAEYKLPILRIVTASLRDDGYLVIGKTETLPDELKSEFEAIDRRRRIYRRY